MQKRTEAEVIINGKRYCIAGIEEEEYLQKIVQEGLGPDLSPADIEQAVTNYLDENGVTLSFDVDANGNLVLKG